MKSSYSLFFYISKRLFLYFCLTLYACVLLIFFIDLVELFRRADGSGQIGWGLLLGIGLLRLPLLVEQLLPLILLFGVLLTCSQLSRSQEFIAMRSMGMSVWQFLAPTLLFAFFPCFFFLPSSLFFFILSMLYSCLRFSPSCLML